MIIKEFRILIPMSVEEYQIGQLYTIQKKSRIESVGAGSGVEIIENKPYESKHEKGQYTLKVYHVDERLPAGLKTATKLLFPKSALLFEEESWNCYPYTRTKYRHKFFTSFNIDIESKYLPDYGDSENVFDIGKKELASRSIDYVDIVNDPINPNEYKIDEDPSLFRSSKTPRGPLTAQWQDELKSNSNKSRATSTLNSHTVKYMCVYKLCRIECAFWGCQSRVEKLISESVLRHMILMSHRQAWCWQDEYFELSMDDVRRLELETQQYLLMKMNNDPKADEFLFKTNSRLSLNDMNKNQLTQELEREGKSSLLVNGAEVMSNRKSSLKKSFSQEDNGSDYADFSANDDEELEKEVYLNKKNKNLKTSNYGSDNGDEDDTDDNNGDEYDAVTKKNSFRNKKIEQDENSNFDEFYDAISQASMSFSFKSIASDGLPKLHNNNKLNAKTPNKKQRFITRIKERARQADKNNKKITTNETKIDIEPQPQQQRQSSIKIQSKGSIKSKQSLPAAGQIDTLILVVHGGNVTCTDTSKSNDFCNFKSTMTNVIQSNYSHLLGRFAFRLVACESICKQALVNLAALSPVVNDNQRECWSSAYQDGSTDLTNDLLLNGAGGECDVFSLHENVQFSALPLLAMANQTQYRISMSKFTKEANKIYAEFLNSDEGQHFDGQIVIIGDSLGSLLVYDSLIQSNNNPNLDTWSTGSNQPRATSPFPNVPPSIQRKQNSFTNSLPHPLINIPAINSSSEDTIDYLLRRTGSSSSRVSNSSGISEFSPQFSPPFLVPPSSTSLVSGLVSGTTTPIPFNNNMQISFDERLDFDVTHFFVLGSPLGLILASRRLASGFLSSSNDLNNNDIPCCSQMYNLFHITDPVAVRIEPLLCKQFRLIEPAMIPRYCKYPLGDGGNLSLDYFIVKHGHLFDTNSLLKEPNRSSSQVQTDYSNILINSSFDQLKSLQKIITTKKQWWGDHRIDYVLYAPEKINNLPPKSLPYIFHSCFWESTDAVAFILRMITKNTLTEQAQCNNNNLGLGYNQTLSKSNSLKRNEPIERWQRRFNRVKLRNLTSNHRANDVIVLEDIAQIVCAKFSYGPLDFALSGEKVDIFVNSSTAPEWQLLQGSVLTDSHGKLKYELPKEKRLSLGMYKICMKVKCDHSKVEFYMAVLPLDTESVVFSIDGSFAANISFSGTDPKVRPGAVDVVRHWQDLGYLIIYVTARPDIQHYKVTNWLAQHNFPLGMCYFSDGLSRDPIRQKTETLRHLTGNKSIKLQAAYGSIKDIHMYASLGVPQNRIFIIGKIKNKFMNQAVFLQDGYASHLNVLKNPNTDSRQASGNARLYLKKFTFTNHQMSINENNTFNSNSGATTTIYNSGSSLEVHESFKNNNNVNVANNHSTTNSTLTYNNVQQQQQQSKIDTKITAKK